MTICKIAIIGGGPAGMAAAVAAYDSGVTDIIILERDAMLGGILNQCIHNGFGLHRFGEELTGPEYADRYIRMVKDRKIKYLTETIVTDISPDNEITAQNTDGILKIKAEAVVLSMGCRERSKGALNIPGSRPAGIFSAGTAQKLMNCYGLHIGKSAVILGSGDIGLIMARRMTLEGIMVKAVCEIMPYSGGLKRNIVQCLEDYNIPLYLSSTVAQIHGKDRVEGVTVAQVDDKRRIIENTKRFIPCDTLLLSVGLIPENDLLCGLDIPIDRATGGAFADEFRQTGQSGVFACGNALHVHDLVDYVSEEAALAGKSAADYVQKRLCGGRMLPAVCGNNIRYIVPQHIHGDSADDVDVFFRVGNPAEHVKIVLRDGDRELFSVPKIKVLPGEMEKITVKAELVHSLENNLTVSAEEIR